jgi:hypothetical protein
MASPITMRQALHSSNIDNPRGTSGINTGQAGMSNRTKGCNASQYNANHQLAQKIPHMSHNIRQNASLHFSGKHQKHLPRR